MCFNEWEKNKNFSQWSLFVCLLSDKVGWAENYIFNNFSLRYLLLRSIEKHRDFISAENL